MAKKQQTKQIGKRLVTERMLIPTHKPTLTPVYAIPEPALTVRCNHPPGAVCVHCVPEFNERLIFEKERQIPGVKNVRDFYIARLGQPEYPSNITSKSFDGLAGIPITSPCGEHCRAAIDAAAKLYSHVMFATGHDYPGINENVKAAALHVVCCYAFG
jgi:hypothetical protein